MSRILQVVTRWRCFKLGWRWRLVLSLSSFLLLVKLVLHITTVQTTYILHEHAYNRTLPLGIPVPPVQSWNLNTHRQCRNQSMAMGVALSFRSKRSYLLHSSRIPLQLTPFFSDLLPTFCSTASLAYCYTFYIAYDYNDPVLSSPKGRFTFLMVFRQVASESRCLERLRINVKFVYCGYTGMPARSQNDAMMAGYKDGMEYYYMTNDDTTFVTPDWAPFFIRVLEDMSPPMVGTTGPTHRGGNLLIMTYNFVHRTHIDIFKQFYPAEFSTWSADAWIDLVYRPYNSYKHPDVHVTHNQGLGTRYSQAHRYPHRLFIDIMRNTRRTLQSYVRTQFPKVCWFYNDHIDST